MTNPELSPRPGDFASYPSLKDRVIFITGGGSGIGAAMVTAFTNQGAKVAFVDIDDRASKKLVATLGKSPAFLHCDLTDIDALKAAVAKAAKKLGPIGVLVNNAARDTRMNAEEITAEAWDAAMHENLRHQFFAAQAVHPHMKKLGSGSIINFSSIAWMAGGPEFVPYATAKAAVVGLTNSLARLYGDDDIRVNAIAPGAVVTEKQLRLWYNEEQAAQFAARQSLHHRLLADEVARLALFLAADDSRMITKQCFVIDAGLR
jgi:NAD(P)-dependent dehydrogenase (short-subunit alcohol dehydrogenase family)